MAGQKQCRQCQIPGPVRAATTGSRAQAERRTSSSTPGNVDTTREHPVSTSRDVDSVGAKSAHPRSIQDSGDEESHLATFAPTEFDQFSSDRLGRVEHLPYSSYLESTKRAIPGMSDLVTLMRQCRREREEMKWSGFRIPGAACTTGEHIVVGEILIGDTNTVHWHDIDCANDHSLQQHSQILAGARTLEEVAMRYLVIDDFSPGAAEVLGHNLGIDAGVFGKHLHQSLEGRSAENLSRFPQAHTRYSTCVHPFIHTTSNTPFALRNIRSGTKNDQTHMIVCPTDMHVVPAEGVLQRAHIIGAAFEEQQLQRVPRSEKPDFEERLFYQMGLRSFMRPSINEDFGPYLPLRFSRGLDTDESPPFQRITFDRSDHVIIHVPENTEIPTVLVLRTPSAWNKPIQSSDLGDVHDKISDNKAQWEVLGSHDCFHHSPVPNLVRRRKGSPTATNPAVSDSQPPKYQGFGFGHSDHEGVNPNMALCQVLVEWHLRCHAGPNIQLQQAAGPARFYFLERGLAQLQTLTIDDYKRAYIQLSNEELRTEQKRRLLDYCRTRATRWEHLHVLYSRMLSELRDSTRFESGATKETLKACGESLQHLVQQVEDQLQKTKGFVSLQLGYIEADQQREIMHNQIELSQIQIAESRKAIQQTETVRKLTILAFVFIPTSTICSFFGMNIKELDNHPRLWIFFTTLIVVITLVLVIAAADSLLTFLMRIFAAIPTLPRSDDDPNPISQTRRWIAIILFKVVHTPFDLIWMACVTLSQKFKKLMSEGHEYWIGYQDPSILRREDDTTSIHTLQYTDKGALVRRRLESQFDYYRWKWREFWHPRPKAGPNHPPMDPIPPPGY